VLHTPSWLLKIFTGIRNVYFRQKKISQKLWNHNHLWSRLVSFALLATSWLKISSHYAMSKLCNSIYFCFFLHVHVKVMVIFPQNTVSCSSWTKKINLKKK
jgi:hypothetical protein